MLHLDLTVSYLVYRILDRWFVCNANCKTIQEICKISLEAKTACGKLCEGAAKASFHSLNCDLSTLIGVIENQSLVRV